MENIYTLVLIQLLTIDNLGEIHRHKPLKGGTINLSEIEKNSVMEYLGNHNTDIHHESEQIYVLIQLAKGGEVIHNFTTYLSFDAIKREVTEILFKKQK